MKRVFFICFLVLTYGCAQTTIYTPSFVEKFTTPDIDSGYIVFPIGNNRYKIMDNNVIRSRLYYEFNSDKFNSYSDFLFHLLNSDDKISIPLEFKTGLYFCKDKRLHRTAKKNFKSFQDTYFYSMENGGYRVKEEYIKHEPQIIQICFDAGLFIYYSCIDTHYSVSNHPIILPPMF